MRGRQKGRDKRQVKFLELLSKGYAVQAACDQSLLSRSNAYIWRRKDAEFAQAWDDAVDAGTDLLEDEARRRAVEGVEEPLVSAGKLVATTRKYSDTLLIFMLKARRPQTYRDNMSVEHSGKDGSPLEIVVRTVAGE